MSANAAVFFYARCMNVLGRVPRSPQVLAAVGPATRKAVEKYGWRCTGIPEHPRAAGMAKVLRLPRGSRVLVPRAERGLNVLQNILRKRGILVTEVTAYRTLPDKNGKHALRHALIKGADAVLFASGSAANQGASDVKLSGAAAVAIGPTTAAALRAHKLEPAAISKRPEPKAFAAAAALALRGKS